MPVLHNHLPSPNEMKGKKFVVTCFQSVHCLQDYSHTFSTFIDALRFAQLNMANPNWGEVHVDVIDWEQS